MKNISLLSSAIAISSLAVAFVTPAFGAVLSSIVCSLLVLLTLTGEYSSKSRSRFAQLYASGVLTRTNPLRLAA